MNRFILLSFVLLLSISCVDKKNDANNISLIKENTQQINDAPQRYFRYVNSKEGLRIRDKPDLTGRVLDVIKHKDVVLIFGKSDNTDFIDGISEYWYSTKINDEQGWVFGGYLKETLAEIDYDEIIGFFFADDIEVKLEDGFNRERYFTVLENGLIDLSGINFEISYIRDDEFFIKYQFPFLESPNPDYNNATFKYSAYSNNPFCQLSGEGGSGGIYLDFYNNAENILLDLHEVRGYYCDEEEDDDNSIQKFSCLITFKKQR